MDVVFKSRWLILIEILSDFLYFFFEKGVEVIRESLRRGMLWERVVFLLMHDAIHVSEKRFRIARIVYNHFTQVV